jgi:hypothetical protein
MVALLQEPASLWDRRLQQQLDGAPADAEEGIGDDPASGEWTKL